MMEQGARSVPIHFDGSTTVLNFSQSIIKTTNQTQYKVILVLPTAYIRLRDIGAIKEEANESLRKYQY
jgi:hypothetical protein